MNNMISNEYQLLIREELETKGFGGTVLKKMKEFVPWLEKMNTENVLDYGCGSGLFKKVMGDKFKVFEYDPARPDASDLPDPCEFVICIDVLEHVEPEYIENVLNDLERVIMGCAYFTIALKPANRKLPNGQNAHILLKPSKWWIEEIGKRFQIYKHILAVGGNGKGEEKHITFYLGAKDNDHRKATRHLFK